MGKYIYSFSSMITYLLLVWQTHSSSSIKVHHLLMLSVFTLYGHCYVWVFIQATFPTTDSVDSYCLLATVLQTLVNTVIFDVNSLTFAPVINQFVTVSQHKSIQIQVYLAIFFYHNRFPCSTFIVYCLGCMIPLIDCYLLVCPGALVTFSSFQPLLSLLMHVSITSGSFLPFKLAYVCTNSSSMLWIYGLFLFFISLHFTSTQKGVYFMCRYDL